MKTTLKDSREANYDVEGKIVMWTKFGEVLKGEAVTVYSPSVKLCCKLGKKSLYSMNYCGQTLWAYIYDEQVSYRGQDNA